jgi:hypothetical protein
MHIKWIQLLEYSNFFFNLTFYLVKEEKCRKKMSAALLHLVGSFYSFSLYRSLTCGKNISKGWYLIFNICLIKKQNMKSFPLHLPSSFDKVHASLLLISSYHPLHCLVAAVHRQQPFRPRRFHQLFRRRRHWI